LRWDCHVHVFGPAARYPLASRLAYDPPERGLAQLEAAAAPAGIDRFVLVQPSVYGTDNACLLDALRAGGGRHRAVAVVDADVEVRRLREMHALGVRGIRFNLVSKAGNSLEGFAELAGKIAPLGWHVQFLAEPADLVKISALRATTAVPFVLDHFGGGESRLLLEMAAREDCWIKLSGFYRLLPAGRPYADMDALLASVAAAAPGRILWGSDWPHTWFFEPGRGAAPAYADTLAPLRRQLPAGALREALSDNPQRLYS
jgi:predicted TIM-barrel fold metal-dependent hydrolase